MIVYKSKISHGLLSFVLLTSVASWMLPAIYGAPTQALVILLIVMIITIAFILHAFFSIHYWINDAEELRIKAGFMNNLSIPISAITKIQKTSSWLASPAASLDRIEILYGKWNSVVISPKDKKGLIAALQSINPKIIVAV